MIHDYAPRLAARALARKRRHVLALIFLLSLTGISSGTRPDHENTVAEQISTPMQLTLLGLN